ncbi:MAG: class I SAM-dependent methyltransferase [Nanoarchaeota archaeon]|nr:class I SAM-dependent methyltransferase [Nanoarchaeota archaeon]
MKKEGFDVRVVSYEHIHNIQPEDEEAMIKAINPKPKEKVLDAFCGYGAVGRNCLEKEPKIDLWLNDESEVQIKRAKNNLSKIPKNHFICSEFEEANFLNSSFDKVIIKMGLHEVPKNEQLIVAKKVFRILKPKGKFIVWDIMLTKETQLLWQEIIRKKDELSGFDMLVKERYFFREDEFLSNMKKAGFKKIKEFRIVKYRFSSRKRLEQELHNDKKRLEQLNEFIRKKFPDNLKKKLNYNDLGDDVQFNTIKKIFVMGK